MKTMLGMKIFELQRCLGENGTVEVIFTEKGKLQSLGIVIVCEIE